MATVAHTNGKAQTNGKPANQKFSGRRVFNYQRPIDAWYWHPALRDGHFRLYDVQAMMQDNAVMIGLMTIYGAMAGAQFEVKANSPDIKRFVEQTIYRFWQVDLMKVLQHYVPYGTCCAEVLYEIDRDTGLWKYAGLDDFHINDIQARKIGRHLSRVRISTNGNMLPMPQFTSNEVDAGEMHWNEIEPPKVFWCGHRPICGQLYGHSALEASFFPWMEKCGSHGAISIRRLWAFANAFRGCWVRYPVGGAQRKADGTMVDNQDIAREIAEAALTGGAGAIPSEVDEHGNQLWEIIDPKINGQISELLEYPSQLDREIWQGMGVLDEVIHAPDVGGSWSGRSGPLLIFLNIEDMRVKELITAFDVGPSGYGTRDQRSGGVIRPLVMENFGEKARYQITPISLVPKPAEPGAGGTGDQAAPAAAMGQGPADTGAQGVPTQPAGPNQVSLSQTIELDANDVQTLLDDLLDEGTVSLSNAGRYSARAADAADRTPAGEHREASYKAEYATRQAHSNSTPESHTHAAAMHKAAYTAHKDMAAKTTGDHQLAHQEAARNHAAAYQHHTQAAKGAAQQHPSIGGVRPLPKTNNPFHSGTGDMRVASGGGAKVAVDQMRRKVAETSKLSAAGDPHECPHCGSLDTRGARTTEHGPDGKWRYANTHCDECDNGFCVDEEGKVTSLSAVFDPQKHPRGQPENAGEFGPGGNQKQAAQGGEQRPRRSYVRTSDEADKIANEIIQTKPLESHEAQAVQAYRSTDNVYKINNYLRGHGGLLERAKNALVGPGAEAKQIAKNLDAAIAKSTIKEDMTVLRGFRLPQGTDLNKVFKPGATFEDRGFVSTTMAEEVADRFATSVTQNQVVMEIEVPKGSNGYHMPRAEGQFDEAEVVLPRGAQFQVKSVEHDKAKNRYKVKVAYVGSRPTALSQDVPQNAQQGQVDRNGRFLWSLNDVRWHKASLSSAHDVSNEPRDPKGKWKVGGKIGKILRDFDAHKAARKARHWVDQAWDLLTSDITTLFSSPEASAPKDREAYGPIANEAEDRSYHQHINTVKAQLESLGVKDMWDTDLHLSPELRQQAVTEPDLFNKKIDHVEMGLTQAMHFAGDNTKAKESINTKIAEIHMLKDDAAKFLKDLEPEVLPDTFGKRGQGKENIQAAAEHIAKGGDAKSAVKHLMDVKKIGKGTAQKYVRQAVKAMKEAADSQLKIAPGTEGVDIGNEDGSADDAA